MSASLVEAVLAAVTGGVVGWVGHYLWAHRESRPAQTAAEPTVVAPSPVLTEPELVESPPAVTVSIGPADPSSDDMRPARSASNRSARGPDEGLGLARQVILHLSRLGRLGSDEVARIGFTQQGMVAALQVRQGTLVRVLQRLRAAGVLEVDRRHVSGVDRRLNVYRLTSLGDSIARDLRRPAAGVVRPAPPAEGPWIAPRTGSAVRRP